MMACIEHGDLEERSNYFHDFYGKSGKQLLLLTVRSPSTNHWQERRNGRRDF